MNTKTDALLALATEVLALDKAAWPGPWQTVFPEILATDPRQTIVCTVSGAASNSEAQHDAALIARYRTLAPQLARAVAGLVKVAEWTQKYGDHMIGCATIMHAWGNKTPACDCGYDAALAALEPPDGSHHD